MSMCVTFNNNLSEIKIDHVTFNNNLLEIKIDHQELKLMTVGNHFVAGVTLRDTARGFPAVCSQHHLLIWAPFWLRSILHPRLLGLTVCLSFMRLGLWSLLEASWAFFFIVVVVCCLFCFAFLFFLSRHCQ